MSENTNLCKFLEWDSAFFNFRIGRVTAETVTPSDMEEILEWFKQNEIDCLYFLVSSRDPQSTKLAETANFHLTDIRITFARNLTNYQKSENPSVRRAKPDDIERLKEIAEVNHRDSRFYYDGNFPSEKCDELFSIWIENSFRGFADAIFVTESDSGKPTGYITGSINKQGEGIIGLVGVSSEAQGKGVGKSLISAVLDWFKDNNVNNVSVATQGRNVEAQRFYQKNGFTTKSMKIWYHLWR